MVRLTLPHWFGYPTLSGVYFAADPVYSRFMMKNELDYTPLLHLFRSFTANLPEGWWKVALLLALALGFGTVLTIKTRSGLDTADYFIWWD